MATIRALLRHQHGLSRSRNLSIFYSSLSHVGKQSFPLREGCLLSNASASSSCGSSGATISASTSRHQLLLSSLPQQLVLRRNYLYLPTSWTELQLRLQSFQQRTIRVRLNLRAAQERLQVNAEERVKRLQFNAQERVNLARTRAITYYSKQRTWLKAKRQQLAARRKAYRLLRLETTTRLISAEDALRQRLKTRSDALRQRLRARTLRFRNNMQSLWARTKKRYNNNMIRGRSILTKRITLKEYSEADWFDAVGRPLTSRDKTGRFVNPWQSQSTAGVHGVTAILSWRWERLKREYAIYGWKVLLPSFWKGLPRETRESMASVASLPALKAVDPSMLKARTVSPRDFQITWLGHATCLLRQGNITILTDPMFSERASPYQDTPVGIARDIPPIYSVQDLPNIDLCLISHDHYDHLDRDSVLQLKHEIGKWIVPTGVGDWLQARCGIPRHDIVELEWWESVRLQRKNPKVWKAVQFATVEDSSLHPARVTPPAADSVWLTCCPAQHWASRTFWDRNFRLWCSFAVFFPQGTFYFAGDTALPPEFPLFEQIAEHIGPVDLAALPIGAYEPDWFMKDSHMNPAEAVLLHKKLNSRKSLGIHWGTFPLSEEPLGEPPLWLQQEAKKAGVDFVTIPHGASISVDCSREEEDSSSYEWIVE